MRFFKKSKNRPEGSAYQETNYMQDVAAKLRVKLEKVCAKHDWQVHECNYCVNNPKTNQPGIFCSIDTNTHKWSKYFTVQKYPNILDLLHALNLDLALLNVMKKYPGFGIVCPSQENEKVTVRYLKTYEEKQLPLEKIYNPETGIINVTEFKEAVKKAWGNKSIEFPLAGVPNEIIPPVFLHVADFQERPLLSLSLTQD